ncbi:MAG: dihydrodipicolinate synthase family protein, partial [Chloroflexi bacterium]|nr:dihydrodipicolinate synthase family protein [Chloroflexota bacterium]
DGLVPCGTTGESPTLSEAERERLIAATVETAAERPSRSRVAVVAGTGTNDTAATIMFQVMAPNGNVILINQASAASPTFDPNAADNTDSVAAFVGSAAARPDLSVLLGESADPVAGSGSVLRYTLTARNDGTLLADGVSLANTLPDGVTFLSASRTPSSISGATLTFELGTLAASNGAPGGADEAVTTIDVRVDLAFGTLLNQAGVSTPATEATLSNNSAQIATRVEEAPEADLGLLKEAPESAPAGGPLSYALVVANAGSGSAASAILADTLPEGVEYAAGSTLRDGAPVADDAAGTPFPLDGAGLALGTLAPGALTRVEFEATLTAASGSVTNSATVTTSSPDSNPADNSASATTRVSVADLAVSAQAPAEALQGAVFDLLVRVDNMGEAAAQSVAVLDALPAQLVYVAGSTRLNGAAFPDDAAGSPFPLDEAGL